MPQKKPLKSKTSASFRSHPALTMAARPVDTTVMPPGKGAAPTTIPVGVTRQRGSISPTPINDRYPIVVGGALTLSYLSSALRLAVTGYRQQLVDLLSELLDFDGDLFSVVSKRVQSVANARVEIAPCDLPEGHPDIEEAADLATYVQSEFDRIQDLGGAIAMIAWALYNGLSAEEIIWTRDVEGWHVLRLDFVHSRRLAYPDAQSWDLYIWDQGQVWGWDAPWASSPTNNGVFGLRIADYPDKYIVHAPKVRSEYPTRDGIGRTVAVWSILKRIGARGAADYLERFAKPMMDVSYATSDDGDPRLAQDEDIDLAKQIAAALGAGTGSYVAHADSIKVALTSAEGGGTAKLTWPEWISICDAEMNKAALGGTLGTDVGKGGGNRALGEVQERGEVDLEQNDADRVGSTLRYQLAEPIVRLNRPQSLRLLPKVLLHVDTDPAPKAIADLAKSLTDIGAPVDLDKVSEKTGIALVKNESGKPRMSFKSDVADPLAVYPDLMSEEAKKQQADALAAQQTLAETRSKAGANAAGGDDGGDGGNPPKDTSAPTKGAAKPKTKAGS